MGGSHSAKSVYQVERDMINEIIRKNCVVMFSKTHCIFCKRVKKLFSELNVPFLCIELDKREDGTNLQSALHDMTGAKTRSLVRASLLALAVGMVQSKDFFRAAVLEHKPRAPRINNMTKQEVINLNLVYYEKAAETSSKQGVDLLLFNEYGLFLNPRSRNIFLKYAEEIPDPKETPINPCDADSDKYILRSISCLAKKYKMYMVVNLLDVHKCDGDKCLNTSDENCSCHSDGYNFYNADAAFDREGNLVARYYKVHPFKELVNVPSWSEYQYFDTEFGRFGLIVCFDSVWKESMELPKEHDVDVLLYPTYWFDDILPLTSVEWQQSWAIANKVHFMGANTQYPNTASLGSGIFSYDEGALVYTYDTHGKSILMIANLKLKNATRDVQKEEMMFSITDKEAVPYNEMGSKFPEEGFEEHVGPAVNESDYRYTKSKSENYTKVELMESSGQLQACHNGFCCDLTYSSDDPIIEDFYLLAFRGLDTVKPYFSWYEETCMLVRCEPLGDEPCVWFPSKSETVFQSVILKAEFSEGVVYPAVSKTYNRLAPKKEWNFESSESGQSKISFVTTNEDPLLKVALMGRIYEQDPPFVPFLEQVKNETSGSEKWLI